ncbi:MAG: hypothetical protein B1H08_01890 [Candidatus Omnitrophica bacterium 4484_171]|nr:MAG: hypothetical protein B1H08_01890 [Candidatus Omnitrophica bacterium 4484_171]
MPAVRREPRCGNAAHAENMGPALRANNANRIIWVNGKQFIAGRQRAQVMLLLYLYVSLYL